MIFNLISFSRVIFIFLMAQNKKTPHVRGLACQKKMRIHTCAYQILVFEHPQDAILNLSPDRKN
jgi:hypothetical protein